MNVKPRRVEDVAELRRLVAAEKVVVQRDRFRAVLLALEGDEAPVVAAKLGRGRTFAQDWVYAYRDGGLDALRPKPRPGRPPRLSPDRLRELAAHLDDLNDPVAHPDGTPPFRGRQIQRHLEEHFGVRYSLSGIYRLLDGLGFSPLRPRPRHPKNDPEAMKAWLEGLPLFPPKSRRRIRESASNGGSRTRCASAKKGR